MARIDISEEQILDSLDNLSPQRRRKAMLRLIAGTDVLERTVEVFRPRVVELARQRGLNWARLSDEERERLVDHVLRE